MTIHRLSANDEFALHETNASVDLELGLQRTQATLQSFTRLPRLIPDAKATHQFYAKIEQEIYATGRAVKPNIYAAVEPDVVGD